MPDSEDARSTSENGAKPAPDGQNRGAAIELQVRAEQVRTLFRQSVPVLLANVINAVILTLAWWSRASHGVLVGWTAVMTLMAFARIQMRRRYWAREWTAEEQEAWAARFTLGSLSAGALWGFAGGALLPDSLPHQVLIVFVIGGMAAGAAATISCVMRAYFAYLVPSLLPVELRLLAYGGDVHLALAAMLALFMVALSLVARNVHAALAQAFRLRFENAALLGQVEEAQRSLVRSNEGLSRANELLERRVEERTAELRDNQQKLAEIVRESPDGIAIFDDAGMVVSANPAIERISGRSLDTLVGKHFAETGALDGDDTRRALDAFQDTLRGESRPPEEFKLRRPNGETVIVEVNPRVVAGGGRQRIHAVIRDVTERHRLQLLKDEYEARVGQTQRLESLGTLAGGVAHDFNNVLTMILSNVDGLSLQAGDPQMKDLLEEIRCGALQAADLTKQLLAFSSQQVLDQRPTDLSRVFKYARPMFERAVGDRCVLSISLPLEPATVLVDATELEHAIVNLLVNARAATPEGGRVTLDVRCVDLDDDPGWPEARAGRYVRISVADTGIGMDEATRARVFEPFFTTKGLGHGTGLGLSTVHGIVKQAAGHVRVISSPGEGSRFEILLPFHAANADVDGEEVSTPGPASSARGTVLVVEDEPQVQRATRRILTAAGYEVLSAENGEQALACAREHPGRIDLLVTDVIMPGLSGVELSRKLLELNPALAVLLVSGYAGNQLGELGELGAGVHFLQKPFDAARLTASARAAVEASRRQNRSKG